jgi:class 3 adenylate cyclase/tetratricopeptide (TPR) repeat protein
MGVAFRPELGAFVPADVRRAMARGEPLPDRGRGSVLEADVSSFTPLTEELARRHGARRGAEEVAALLTRVYGAVIAEVDRCAGSVVEFTGDALACCFDADDDGARAVHCGLAMQAATAALRTDTTDSPALKVTVAAGDYRRFSVGDPTIRLLEVLAGPAVDRLVAVAPATGAGEVVVDPATARLLGDRLELGGGQGPHGAEAALVVATLRGAEPPAPAAPAAISPEQARPWLPAAVHERIAGGDEHLLGELRSVVGLFARFGGIDYDADDAGARLDAYAKFAQQTLDGYGGTLFSIAIDAKGSYLCAGFGAPVAHDDDPLRAAAAALALTRPPERSGGVAAGGIGLARGRLYAGLYGGATRRTFGLQGNTMNLAARLMESAGPGQILVEESLAQLLDDRNELQHLAPLLVKGRAEPVEARALISSRHPAPVAPAAPHLVNRTHERGALESCLRRLRGDRSGGVVVLEGEAGIGKTRLVRHLTDLAAAAGVAVHAGSGDPIERGAPYHGWRSIFTGALGLDAMPADPGARLELVRERLAPFSAPSPAGDAADVAALFSAVLPLQVPEGPVSGGLYGEARGEATRDLLAHTLGTLAGAAPTLVVLEDAHWLDSASLALALRLAVAPGPLLLVLTTRPVAESAPSELERLLAMPECQLLRIRPLDGSESLELAVRAIGGEATARLAELIEAKAGGNPLFTRELAYAMRDGDLLGRIVDGRPQGDSLEESPDRVETVIASRVDRLPPAAQTLLKVGSVLGGAFAEDTVRALAGPRALEQRGRLEQLELLAPPSPTAPGMIAFRHALIRDVVYSQLLYAQRRDLHARAAEYYEQADVAGATPAALAHHWEQAEVPARAVVHLVAAGEAALRAGAFRECLEAYERALELSAGDLPEARRAEWTWHAAHACYRLGYIDRSRELGAQAIAALDQPVPTGAMPAVVVAALGELARQAAHRLLPRLLPRPAPPAAHDEIRFAGEALVMMAEVYYVAADKARSSYVALRALNLVESIPPCPELARSYGAMSIIAGLVGLHWLAERYAELAQQTSALLDDPECAAHTLQQISMYRSSVGPYDAFGELYAAAIDGYRRLGNRPRLRDTAGMAAIADHLFGRPELAEARMNELLDAVEPHEVTLGAAWAHLWLGIVALRRGDPDEALRRLATADGLRDRDAVDIISVNVHAISALALWRSGRDAEAAIEEEAARALVRRLGRRPAAHIVLDGYCALAEIALAGWDEARSPAQRLRARLRARDARRSLRTFARSFAIGAPARWLYEAERARRLGHDDRALAAWQRALEAATKLDMRHELALAHAALADHLPAAPDAARHRAEGARLLAELGEPAAARAVAPR